LCNTLRFVLLKSKGQHEAPGGAWLPQDGPDPYDDETLKKTACRTVLAQTNIDLSQCVFHNFMELFYETDCSKTRVVYVMPEVWGLESPLQACRSCDEETQEYTNKVEEEVELTQEEIAAFKQEWADKLQQEKAEAEKEVEGESEEDRAARLEQFNKSHEEKEANPPEAPKTKKTVKEVTQTRCVKHPRQTPVLMSLLGLAEHWQIRGHADFTEMFEAKLFALSFDEMLRNFFGTKVIEWLRLHPENSEAPEPSRDAKRKLDSGEEEQDSKRQKNETAAEESESNDTDMAAPAGEQGEQDKTQEKAEGGTEEKEDAAAAVDDDKNAKEEPQPTPKFKLVTVEDKAAMEPFYYFDCSSGQRSHLIPKERIESLLLSIETLCYREVEEMMKSLKAEACTGVYFNYLKACSHVEKELIPDSPPRPTEASASEKPADETAEAGEPADMETSAEASAEPPADEAAAAEANATEAAPKEPSAEDMQQDEDPKTEAPAQDMEKDE
jgi:hypothetical protein